MLSRFYIYYYSYKVTFTLPPCAGFIEILITVKGNLWGMGAHKESKLELSNSTGAPAT
jgi:hypothetical protein